MQAPAPDSEAALEATRAAVRDLKRSHATTNHLAMGRAIAAGVLEVHPGSSGGLAVHPSRSGDGGGWVQDQQNRCASLQ